MTSTKVTELADGNTDDAPEEAIIAAIIKCAQSWQGEARIIGNVRAKDIVRALSRRATPDLPKPDTNRAGQEPCGECHMTPGEVCDICGASRPGLPASWRPSQRLIEAVQKWEEIKADLDDFDGDRRGIAEALMGAERQIIQCLTLETDECLMLETDALESMIASVVIDAVRSRRSTG